MFEKIDFNYFVQSTNVLVFLLRSLSQQKQKTATEGAREQKKDDVPEDLEQACPKWGPVGSAGHHAPFTIGQEHGQGIEETEEATGEIKAHRWNGARGIGTATSTAPGPGSASISFELLGKEVVHPIQLAVAPQTGYGSNEVTHMNLAGIHDLGLSLVVHLLWTAIVVAVFFVALHQTADVQRVMLCIKSNNHFKTVLALCCLSRRH